MADTSSIVPCLLVIGSGALPESPRAGSDETSCVARLNTHCALHLPGFPMLDANGPTILSLVAHQNLPKTSKTSKTPKTPKTPRLTTMQ